MLNQVNCDAKSRFLKLFEPVCALDFPKSEYLIAGSGPLAIRNIKEARDVDLWVSPMLWEQLSSVYPVTGPKKNCIIIEQVEIWNDYTHSSSRIGI